ncbi:MAG TPA: recombinase RecA [Myxococcaceae bacterium]|nr:recombinase RecA [Myxococcaceae bacterium]
MEAARIEKAGTVELLRERIRKLQAAPRQHVSVLRTGVAALDALMPSGGFPLGQGVELWGEAASGRTSLALRAVASAHRENRLCAYVDGPGELYPPCAAALGVDLQRLLVVRPKAPGQCIWAATQLLRSAAFACVVLDLTHTGVRMTLAESKRLTDATSKGGSLLLVLTPPDAPAEGMTRLQTWALGPRGLEVEVVRGRHGATGEKTVVAWEELYPGQAPRYRYRDELPAPDQAPSEMPERFVRLKSYWKREGHGTGLGIAGGRPGRDTRLPRMDGTGGRTGGGSGGR